MFARTRIALAVAPALVMLLSACSSSTATPAAPQSVVSSAPVASASAPASSAAAPKAPADAATLAVKMADSSLGSILVDGKGMALYMYTKDTQGAKASVCTGGCLAAWPALLGKPTMGAGVDDSKLGSFTRADGSVQATYNGWPLYYYAKDTKVGDVTGQNVGTVWFVLDHDGNPVKK
jgi:predicted lipoprotein with Yx(FWY)xxD motif